MSCTYIFMAFYIHCTYTQNVCIYVVSDYDDNIIILVKLQIGIQDVSFLPY